MSLPPAQERLEALLPSWAASAYVDFGRSSAYHRRRHGWIRRALYERWLDAADPAGAEGWAWRARALSLLDRPKEAAAALKKALAAKGPKAEALAFRWDAGPDGRAADLDAAVGEDPSQAAWRLWRAFERMRRGGASRAALAAVEADLDAAGPGQEALRALAPLGRSLLARLRRDAGGEVQGLDAAVRLEPGSAWPLALRARLHARRKDVDLLLADCDAAVALDDNALGLFALAGGAPPDSTLQADELARAAEKILSSGDGPHWAYVLRGNFRRSPKQGEVAGGLDDLRKAVALAPSCGWAWAFLGRALFASGQAAAGLEALDRAVGLSPERGWQRVWRGEALRRLGRLEAALKDLDEGLRLDPDYELGYGWRGGLLRALGRSEEALPDLQLAAALDPVYVWTHHQLVRALADTGRLSEALEVLDHAHAKDPKFAWAESPKDAAGAAEALEGWAQAPGADPRLWGWAGHSRLTAGRAAEAEADLSRALKRRPLDGRFWCWRAQARLSLGRRAEARKDADNAVRFAPDYAPAWAWRGRLASRASDLAKALKLDPTLAWAWGWKGEAELKAGKGAQAAASFDRALELDRGAWATRAARSAALLKAGKRAAAEKDWEGVLAQAQAWSEGGDAVKARELLEAAVALRPKEPRAAAALAALRTPPAPTRAAAPGDWWSSAFADLETAVEAGPPALRPPLKRAVAALLASDGGKARQALREALAQDAASPAAAGLMGLSLTLQPGEEEARPWLDRAVAGSPAAWPRLLRALSNWKLGRLDEARKDLDAAVALKPAPELYGARAACLTRMGYVPEAIADLDRALGLGGPRARLLAERAQLYLHRRRYDRALRDLSRCVRLEPDRAERWAKRAELYTLVSRLERAQTDIDRAASLEPAQARWSLQRLRVLLLRRKTDEAKAAIAALRKAPGGAEEADFYSAYLDMQQGRWPQAAASLRALSKQGGGRAERARFYMAAAAGFSAVGPQSRRKDMPKNTPDAKTGRLDLCGLGLFPPYTATLEVLHAVAATDVVFNNVAGPEVREFLGAFSSNIRPATYDANQDEGRWVEEMFADLQRGRNVAFVTRGHPLVLGGLARALVRRCKAEGVEHRTFGAVSSIDVLLARMGLALGDDVPGLQAFDLPALEAAATLNTTLPLMLYFYRGLKGPQVAAARKELERFYEGEQACWMAGPQYDTPPVSFALKEFEQRFPEVHPSLILCLPPKGKSTLDGN